MEIGNWQFALRHRLTLRHRLRGRADKDDFDDAVSRRVIVPRHLLGGGELLAERRAFDVLRDTVFEPQLDRFLNR